MIPAVLTSHHTSDFGELLFFCVLGFAAGIGLFFYGFRLLQRRRLILDTPLSKIRSTSMGMVEISGLAVGPYTLTAPITGRPCYYYRTKVWEWIQNGKNKQWVMVAGECAHVPFFVDDNTGRVLVDPRGAELDLHCDFKEQFNSSFFSSADVVPSSLSTFLMRHGVGTSSKIKVEEHCIKPKNSLFILGTLAENPGIEVGPDAITEAVVDSPGSVPLLSFQSIAFAGGGGVTNELGTRLLAAHITAGSNMAGANSAQSRIHPLPKIDPSIYKTAQQQKIAAALLQAGIGNPEAWAAAGVPWPTPHATPAPSPRPRDPDLCPPVVLMKGENNKNFLISWRSQQEVARSLGWKCLLMIWGGPVVALVSLYFFLFIENWL